MNNVVQEMVQIISKPCKQRSEAEIDLILPWFRRRSQLLKNQEKLVLGDILRNCSYQVADEDDVIIRQGDIGDCMFVVLRGQVSVYIDGSLATSEEDAGVATLFTPSPVKEAEAPAEKIRAEDRSIYGKHIVTYEAGKSFGEVALLSEDSVRNASIIADKPSGLMVIDRELFNRCLKAYEQSEYAAIKRFVRRHPYFSHLSSRMLRLLELSLRKEQFSFNSPIVRQGDPVTGLIFITNGQAELVVESGRHKFQYSSLWPFEAGIDIYSTEFDHLRESRRQAILRKYEDPSVIPTKPDSLVLRRSEGYATMERLQQERALKLCSIIGGEILGDAELILNLPTYMQTVTCSTDTTAYILDQRNLDRILANKKNIRIMDIIKEHVIAKLKSRLELKQAKSVEFFGFILHKLTEEALPTAKKLPPLKNTKALPEKNVQRQHLLELFREGKAPLVEPVVPGALIYRDLMQENARIRANIRRRSTVHIKEHSRLAKQVLARRKPRSRREIMESLQAMLEAEVIDMKQKLPRRRVSNSSNADLPPTRRESLDRQSVTSIKSPVAPQASVLVASSSSKLGTSGSLKAAPFPSKNIKPSVLSSHEENQRKHSLKHSEGGLSLPPIREEASRGSMGTSQSIQRPLADILRRPSSDVVKPENVSAQAGETMERLKADAQTSREEDKLPPISTSKSDPASAMDATFVTQLPGGTQHGPEEGEGHARKWDTALRFVNERIQNRFTRQILDHDLDFADYETCDSTLALLENRIKDFHKQHAQPGSDVTKSRPPTYLLSVDMSMTSRTRVKRSPNLAARSGSGSASVALPTPRWRSRVISTCATTWWRNCPSLTTSGARR